MTIIRHFNAFTIIASVVITYAWYTFTNLTTFFIKLLLYIPILLTMFLHFILFFIKLWSLMILILNIIIFYHFTIFIKNYQFQIINWTSWWNRLRWITLYFFLLLSLITILLILFLISFFQYIEYFHYLWLLKYFINIWLDFKLVFKVFRNWFDITFFRLI
jgi:hypothetical protein